MLTQNHSDEEPHHHLLVGEAQLVERWVVVPEVAGSNPVTHPKSSISVQFS